MKISEERRDTLFAAVLNRIGRQGDMHIRIRGSTFRYIITATGLQFNFSDDESYREIDAAALEALLLLRKW